LYPRKVFAWAAGPAPVAENPEPDPEPYQAGLLVTAVFRKCRRTATLGKGATALDA
jgi:hypothetical protein